MRSIPQAMTWELLARGRWMLSASFLLANALPIFLLAALRHDGALDVHDRSNVIMHMMLMQIGAFIFGAAILGSQGPLIRLYVFPLPTSTLVAWRLLPAMALMFLQSVASTLLLNGLFQLDWPVWGPAMFLAVTLAALYAAIWLAEKSGWIILALTVVSSLLGLWNKSRYGELFSQPQHMWREVTPGEVAAMLAVAIVSYVVAVFAVARNRRGESLPQLGLVAWLMQVFDRPGNVSQAFRSEERAQFWYEWVRKGLAMPVATALGVFVGVVCWTIWSRDSRALLEGVVTSGGLLSILAMICGLVLGHTGNSDTSFQMGSFLATRPVTSTSLAHTLLRMTALSVLLMWLIWAATLLLVWLILLSLGAAPAIALPKSLGWWYFPVTLVGPWIVVTVGVVIGLFGRVEISVKALLALVAGYIATELAIKFTMTPTMRLQFWNGVIVACGAAATLFTTWSAVLARRRGLIDGAQLWLMAVAWGLLLTVLVIDFALYARAPAQAYLFFAGVASLVVAPLGAAPLALSWNRVR